MPLCGDDIYHITGLSGEIGRETIGFFLYLGTISYQQHYFVSCKSWWSSHVSVSGLLPFPLQPLRSWQTPTRADPVAGQPVTTCCHCIFHLCSRIRWSGRGSMNMFFSGWVLQPVLLNAFFTGLHYWSDAT